MWRARGIEKRSGESSSKVGGLWGCYCRLCMLDEEGHIMLSWLIRCAEKLSIV